MNIPDTLRSMARSLEFGGGATMEHLVSAHMRYQDEEHKPELRAAVRYVARVAKQSGRGRIYVLRMHAAVLDADHIHRTEHVMENEAIALAAGTNAIKLIDLGEAYFTWRLAESRLSPRSGDDKSDAA